MQVTVKTILLVLIDFCTSMYDTSYLNMQHLGTGHIFFVLAQVFAKFQQSCNLEASLQIVSNIIDSLSKTLY